MQYIKQAHRSCIWDAFLPYFYTHALPESWQLSLSLPQIMAASFLPSWLACGRPDPEPDEHISWLSDRHAHPYESPDSMPAFGYRASPTSRQHTSSLHPQMSYPPQTYFSSPSIDKAYFQSRPAPYEHHLEDLHGPTSSARDPYLGVRTRVERLDQSYIDWRSPWQERWDKLRDEWRDRWRDSVGRLYSLPSNSDPAVISCSRPNVCCLSGASFCFKIRGQEKLYTKQEVDGNRKLKEAVNKWGPRENI